MGHLLAYQNGSQRHLARWNDTSSTNKTTLKHLGAGKVVAMLQCDAVRHFTFGSYVTKTAGSTTFPAAVGYTGACSPAGESAVAETLRSAVEAATSSWPYMGDDWAQTDVSAPVFWHVSGGVGVSQESYVGAKSEACMSIVAKHFTLPDGVGERVAAGDLALSARARVKGVGSWLQPMGRDASADLFATVGTVEANPNYWGGSGSSAYTRRVQFATYQDSLSLGVHCVAGGLAKSNFSPKQCFFVRSVCPKCGASSWVDLRRLYAGYYMANGSNPTDGELESLFGVDMDDDANGHFIGWTWHGTRSDETSSSSRFAEQDWAASNGGDASTQAVFTATGGTGWGPPHMPGAEWNPHDGSLRLFGDFRLRAAHVAALAEGDGVWLMATQLPLLAASGLSRAAFSSHFDGYASLPSSEAAFEAGPCVNTLGTSSTLDGKQMCSQVSVVSDVGLEITIE